MEPSLPPTVQLLTAVTAAGIIAAIILALIRILRTTAKYLIPVAAVLYFVLEEEHPALEQIGAAVVDIVDELMNEPFLELPLAAVKQPKSVMNTYQLVPDGFEFAVTRTAVEVFAVHVVIAAVSVAVLYLVMETWYPAILLALPGIPALVAWGETLLWLHAESYLPLFLYQPDAALSGAFVGALLAIAIGEPQLQKRDRNERSNNGILEEL